MENDVVLRAFREDDLDVLATWWLHEDVRDVQSDWPVPRPLETLREMFRGWGANGPDADSVALAVDVDGALAGYVAVLGFRNPGRTGELAVMIGPEHQGRGIGHRAMAHLLVLTFARLDLHRVEVRVFAVNPRAVALYSSLGLVEEGRLRERVLLDGRRHDLIVMGLLRTEWLTRAAYGES